MVAKAAEVVVKVEVEVEVVVLDSRQGRNIGRRRFSSKAIDLEIRYVSNSRKEGRGVLIKMSHI